MSSQTGDVRRKQAGPFQVKAAINACQMAEPAPDWPQTLPLYTVLEKAGHHPAARTAYGRAIALATSDSDRLLLTERAAQRDSSRGS